ncbi:lipoprotein insertase outer membrane protein LolB [Cellvibrio mixtus]|uniref:lipoprotein insertase outer membrane protein LolB n=1 Tax=Cellvibrio mixtus TaxID=39650 RepID=UPI000693ADDC|nr:lipoprotein insertase outer membrane protein LolB [Cellvibrio mixtus]
MMCPRFIRQGTLLLLILLTAACAHRPGLTPPENVLEHQRQVQAIGHWQVNGKLGIRTADDSGSASLKWNQEAANYQINLSGPLGQKRMLITGTADKVRLEQTGEPAQEAKSPEALIKQQLGWTLPVTQLAYWVRGVPAPKGRINRLEQNSIGLIAQLQQGDWLVTYDNYSDQQLEGKTLPLPGKITAEYQDVRLILVIRQWQLGIPKQ